MFHEVRGVRAGWGCPKGRGRGKHTQRSESGVLGARPLIAAAACRQRSARSGSRAHLVVPIAARVGGDRRRHLDGWIALVELYPTIYQRHAVDGRRGRDRYPESDLRQRVINSQISATYVWTTPGVEGAGVVAR